jgi:thioredoxin reductase (NADPH)
MAAEELDLVVVGAGPAGLAAAIAAGRAGLAYAVVEKGVLVNSVYRYPHGMTFFTTAELLEIGDLPFVTPHPKPTREEALIYYRRVVDACGVEVALGETVHEIDRDGGALVVSSTTTGRDERRARRARHVLVATGYYDHPKCLGVPGEDLPHVSHYFDEPHPFHHRRVVVVGGGNSAAEAALLLFRAGASVTLVHRRERLADSIKYWVKPDVENRIQQGSIAARFASSVVEIRRDLVVVEGPAGREEIPADAVFLLTGYRPDVALLARAGVRIDPATLAPEHDPDSFETNVSGLYVAGGIVAGANTSRIFIENGRFHGAQAVRAILAKMGRTERAVPPPRAASGEHRGE